MTVRVKLCVALGGTPLAAVTSGGGAGGAVVRAAERGRPVAVVGERHAAGQGPVSVSAGVGKPVVVTVKLPAVPVVKVVLVRAGDRRRLVDRQGEVLGSVGLPTPLEAVKSGSTCRRSPPPGCR